MSDAWKRAINRLWKCRSQHPAYMPCDHGLKVCLHRTMDAEMKEREKIRDEKKNNVRRKGQAMSNKWKEVNSLVCTRCFSRGHFTHAS